MTAYAPRCHAGSSLIVRSFRQLWQDEGLVRDLGLLDSLLSVLCIGKTSKQPWLPEFWQPCWQQQQLRQGSQILHVTLHGVHSIHAENVKALLRSEAGSSLSLSLSFPHLCFFNVRATALRASARRPSSQECHSGRCSCPPRLG